MPKSLKTNKLSKRLERILSLITPSKNLYDICCDHGELGIEALQRELCENLILIDRVPSIISNLSKKLEVTDIPSRRKIRVLCEDAAKNPRHFSNSTIIIAGIGESTGIKILDNYTFLDNCELILSIHSDNYDLRQYLIQRKFKVMSECIVKEKGKFYEIIKLSPSIGKEVSPVGEDMWSNENPESQELLSLKVAYLEKVLSHCKNEKTQEILVKLKSILRSLA